VFCRYPETLGEFHDDLHDGLLSICRKLLRKAFPCLDVNGYKELLSAAPVVYVGEAAKDIGLYICSQVVHQEEMYNVSVWNSILHCYTVSIVTVTL